MRIINDDMGTSSSTISECYYNQPTGTSGYSTPDIPYDPSDFGRCHRFLLKVKKEEALRKVVERHPFWKPFVDNWEKMEELWLEESPSKKAPKLFKLMQSLTRDSAKVRETKND